MAACLNHRSLSSLQAKLRRDCELVILIYVAPVLWAPPVPYTLVILESQTPRPCNMKPTIKVLRCTAIPNNNFYARSSFPSLTTTDTRRDIFLTFNCSTRNTKPTDIFVAFPENNLFWYFEFPQIPAL